MKNLKKFLSVVMAILVLLSTFAVSSFAAPSSKDRYSVLVLDCSGSMSGNKIEELKEGAVAFCEQVLSSNRSNNKIAIVTFASGSYLACDFTDDLTTLNDTISNLYASGGTDLTNGLYTAKTALDAISGDVIKNMLVMCDGAPNNANTAYDVVKGIPLHWNIYGLYYCPNGTSTSAITVMKNVGRNGYYEVTDGSALTFTFIDNGTTITTKSVNNVEVRIACPVDVSVTLNGITLNKYNTQTTFGTLEFEGENNEIKILKLAYRNDYIIDIVGTGDGTMDYSIAYYCNDEQLYNLDYPTVDINPSTHIITGIDIDKSDMTLEVDSDGDGNADDNVSPNVSTTNIWYRIQQFFDEFFYNFKEFFKKLFSFDF